MANITLPSNPVNGQKVVIGTRLFQYDSNAVRWKSRVFQPLGDTTITAPNEAPTITASLSEIALDTSGANVSFTYTVSDVDSSILKVSHSVSGIANSDLATVTHHRANNTVTITAGTEEFANGQITLTVTDGRNNATDTVDVSAAYGWAVDLTQVTYDNKSFSVGSQEGNPYTVAFSENGSKFYVTGNGTDTVYEYDMTTPFDISTASYNNVSLSVSGQTNSPSGVRFRPDGTFMYVVSNSSKAIFEYSLTTPFDLSTASYTSVFGNLSSLTLPWDVSFKSDGTKVFIVDDGSNAIHQFSFGTPWDLSTLTNDSVSIATGMTYPRGVVVNPLGTKMYVVGFGIRQFTLSTPWDLSTASYDNVSLSIPQDTQPFGMDISSDGKKLYVTGDTNNAVYQYSTGL